MVNKFLNELRDACMCPLLSIGREEAVACQDNCALYNTRTQECALGSLEMIAKRLEDNQ